jgi:galactokinase
MDRRERLAAVLAPEDLRWFRAPGRVNLMGDHTDYNEGLVLPVAIDRDCLIASRPRSDGRVRVRSLEAEGSVDVAADGSEDPAAVEPAWGRYVAGVVRALAELGRPPVGVDAVLSSTVPVGSGLASSGALEVALALALCDAAWFSAAPEELAAACRDAELAATGVPCGIMDQLVALRARAGSALLIDCRSLELEPVPLPPDLAILAVHSGLPRALETSAYAERRAACEAAARRLGLPALRDATADQVLDEPVARHVVSENARVAETALALRAGDRPALGGLFGESHASLRDDFGVSTPELDALVSALVDSGAVGARLTGAGFGGCVIALVERRRLVHVVEAAVERYRAETGIEPEPFVCRSSSAAGPAT